MRAARPGRRQAALAAVLIGGASAGWAAPPEDAELAATRRRSAEFVAAGEAPRAQALVETLARSRPDDPRGWELLGDLRLAAKAKRGATYAYHRAAALAGEETRGRIEGKLAAAELAPVEARLRATSVNRLARWARGSACVDGGFAGDGVRCGPKATVAPAYRVPAALLTVALQREEPWIRWDAVRNARLEDLVGIRATRMNLEKHPRVLEAYLRRLAAAAAELPLDAPTLRAVRRQAEGANPELRRLAGQVLYMAGEAPEATPAAFADLVRQADEDKVSKSYVVQVFSKDPAGLIPALVGLLEDPYRTGKFSALQILARAGGDAGAQALARAFADPSETLLQYAGTAQGLLAPHARARGRTLGSDPTTWWKAVAP